MRKLTITIDVDKARSSERYDSVDWWRLDVHDLGIELRLVQTRNHYTTASLVINHANAIDLTEKVFLQTNREHKQKWDERNLKLQINMRLKKTRRSSSLYSKGLIATGE